MSYATMAVPLVVYTYSSCYAMIWKVWTWCLRFVMTLILGSTVVWQEINSHTVFFKIVAEDAERENDTGTVRL
jgi:hypothetical protein